MNPNDTPAVPTPENNTLSSLPPEKPAPTTSTSPAPPPPTSPRPKRNVKLLVVIVAIVVVLLGGSAAAYFAVIVPNKPENLLKKAVANLAEQTTFSAKGNLSIKSGDTTVDLNVNMLHLASDQKTMLLDTELAFSGVKLPIEARYVDQNAYIKVGDLSTLKTLAALGGSDAVSSFNLLSSKLSNQWIEVDKTLLEEANIACSLEGLFDLMDKDTATASADLLQDEQYKFFTVKNSSKDTVDGQDATKIEVTVDKAKLLSYSTKLEELPAYQSLAKCDSSDNADVTKEATDAAENTTINTFAVWVDGSKRIKRIELQATNTQSEETAQVKLDFTLLDQPVTVDKPTDAKPLMQLIGELYQPLGGSSTLDPRSLSNSLSL